jgi:hypothetical protein
MTLMEKKYCRESEEINTPNVTFATRSKLPMVSNIRRYSSQLRQHRIHLRLDG